MANKANVASPAFTGTPTAPTAAAATNNTQIATTQFVHSTVSGKANLASPAFTGTPTAPTATNINTNTTQIATTAFVHSQFTQSGNWTPTAYGSTTAGTPSYAAQDGRYTVIGPLVWISFRLAVGLAGASGGFTIGGLPFASADSVTTSGGVMSQSLNLPPELRPHAFHISGSNISLPHPTENRLIHANEVTVPIWFYGTAVYRRAY